MRRAHNRTAGYGQRVLHALGYFSSGQGSRDARGAATMTTEYYVKFETNEETTAAEANWLADFDGENSLEVIVEACQSCGVDATLLDAAGFTKGYVKADGSYQLS